VLEVADEGRCISNVGKDKGCDEDIDAEARRIPENKKRRRSPLNWIPFRRLFRSDCEYGETIHLGEMSAEASVACRRFLLPSHPR
jgi:hypothetical protein